VDIRKAFGIPEGRLTTIPLGVNTDQFRPSAERVPGRIVCVASADAPLKGVSYLLEAVAKLRAERQVELVLVSKLVAGGPSDTRIDELSIRDSVRVVSGLDDDELADLLASAEVACVPSLYEGFSLPAVEAMSCGTPLVATRAGAIPEVVGEAEEAALLVPPMDSGALATALGRLLDDAELRGRLGAGGRERVEARYSWAAVAAKTAQNYQEAIDEFAGTTTFGQSEDLAPGGSVANR
jgi:glycosyltransferase involved in cell wall biosynthesis